MSGCAVKELTDMHFVHGEYSSNTSATIRRYQRRFPQRIIPNRKLRVADRLRCTKKNKIVGKAAKIQFCY